MGGQQTHFCRSISLLPNPQYNIRLLPYFCILTPSPLYPRKKEGSAILRSLQMMEQFYSPESLIVVVEGKRRKEQLFSCCCSFFFFSQTVRSSVRSLQQPPPTPQLSPPSPRAALSPSCVAAFGMDSSLSPSPSLGRSPACVRACGAAAAAASPLSRRPAAHVVLDCPLSSALFCVSDARGFHSALNSL